MIKYYIVYHQGNKSKLSIIALSNSESHELNDYSVASRKDFDKLDEVIAYARELSTKHGLTLDSSEDEIKKELLYLD